MQPSKGTDRQFKIATGPGAVYYLRATNAADRPGWIECIEVHELSANVQQIFHTNSNKRICKCRRLRPRTRSCYRGRACCCSRPRHPALCVYSLESVRQQQYTCEVSSSRPQIIVQGRRISAHTLSGDVLPSTADAGRVFLSLEARIAARLQALKLLTEVLMVDGRLNTVLPRRKSLHSNKVLSRRRGWRTLTAARPWAGAPGPPTTGIASPWNLWATAALTATRRPGCSPRRT